MNREDDTIYYERRARQERDRAERATDTAVKAVHRILAAEYARRIDGSATQAAERRT